MAARTRRAPHLARPGAASRASGAVAAGPCLPRRAWRSPLVATARATDTWGRHAPSMPIPPSKPNLIPDDAPSSPSRESWGLTMDTDIDIEDAPDPHRRQLCFDAIAR